ncbi:ABC transporter substrate-binding protein [Euzebya sp.]|uniref:ABC transporter substrate-binding protein n=1 Tax=Euzebya sp. TaxID=1971409 RepID=UPI0035126186
MLVALVATTAASCTAAPDGPAVPTGRDEPIATPTGPGGGTFRYGIGSPTAIVPPLAATPDDQAVVDAAFDSLTAWDDAGSPQPSAATTWSADDALVEWRFTLRPGASFHDGTSVTAADFAAAWATLVAEGGYGYLLADVVGYEAARDGDGVDLAGVRVVDDLTLEVSLTRPRADFATVVGHPALGPVHRGQRERDEEGWRSQPLGNGPFALTEPWARGDFIRAAAWEGWRNGDRAEGGIAEVLFRIGDLDINYLAFTQGRRDLSPVPSDALALAAEEYPARGGEWDGPGLITGRRPEVYLLAMNPAVPPYDDVAVREAVSLVVDRAGLAAANEGGNLDPATGLLPPSLPGARADTCELCTFNTTGAQQRLEDADVDELAIWFNAEGGHERIRNAIRAALSGIGVRLVSNGRRPPPDLAAYQDLLETGEAGLFRLPLVADVPSGLSVLYPLLHGDEVPARGGMNYMRYDNAQVNSLLDQAAATGDDQQRQDLLRRVESLALNRDHVVVPLFTYRHAVVVAERVRDLRYGPMGLVDLTRVSLVG